MRKTVGAILVLILLALTAVASAQPRNVVVLIGDGMGFSQVNAAGMFLYGLDYDSDADHRLSFQRLPYQGQLTTYSANASATDSAAAATALATGVKVDNGVISVATPGDGQELPTLLERYRDLGRSTGLVSTAYITHATPAGFGAHEPDRGNNSQIALDYFTQTQPNVLFGGGGNGINDSAAVAAAATAGYTVVTTRITMQQLDTDLTTRVSGQFGTGHMPYEHDGSYATLPHLTEMTVTALDILDNDPDGFFLMVEGGRIDHACHDHVIERAVEETIEFAETVQDVLDWASGRSDTLVLVTADHETGGLTIDENLGAGAYPDVSWATGGHTGANVPVYAWGPNADLVTGVLDNTDVFDIVMAPEPGSMLILAGGFCALLSRRRHRRVTS